MTSEVTEITQLLNLESIMEVLVAAGAFISIFVEISPIKWNPISSLCRWLGKHFNGELLNRIDSLQDQINKIKKENDKRNAIECRVRILGFGDELRQGVRHSKESFIQILDDITVYDNYCKTHPNFLNERTVLTTKKIKDIYWDNMTKNNFL